MRELEAMIEKVDDINKIRTQKSKELVANGQDSIRSLYF